MKKILLTLLIVIVGAGILAGAGFAGYRIGFRQGALATTDGNIAPSTRGFQLGPRNLPFHNFGRDFDRDFQRGIGPGGFDMMRRGGMGFGLFAPLMFLGQIVFWGLITWFAYWLFTKSGWRIIRTNPPASSVPDEKTEIKN